METRTGYLLKVGSNCEIQHKNTEEVLCEILSYSNKFEDRPELYPMYFPNNSVIL